MKTSLLLVAAAAVANAQCDKCGDARACFYDGGCEARNDACEWTSFWSKCSTPDDASACGACYPDSKCASCTPKVNPTPAPAKVNPTPAPADPCAACQGSAACFTPGGCSYRGRDCMWFSYFEGCNRGADLCAACFPDSQCSTGEKCVAQTMITEDGLKADKVDCIETGAVIKTVDPTKFLTKEARAANPDAPAPWTAEQETAALSFCGSCTKSVIKTAMKTYGVNDPTLAELMGAASNYCTTAGGELCLADSNYENMIASMSNYTKLMDMSCEPCVQAAMSQADPMGGMSGMTCEKSSDGEHCQYKMNAYQKKTAEAARKVMGADGKNPMGDCQTEIYMTLEAAKEAAATPECNCDPEDSHEMGEDTFKFYMACKMPVSPPDVCGTCGFTSNFDMETMKMVYATPTTCSDECDAALGYYVDIFGDCTGTLIRCGEDVEVMRSFIEDKCKRVDAYTFSTPVTVATVSTKVVTAEKLPETTQGSMKSSFRDALVTQFAEANKLSSSEFKVTVTITEKAARRRLLAGYEYSLVGTVDDSAGLMKVTNIDDKLGSLQEDFVANLVSAAAMSGDASLTALAADTEAIKAPTATETSAEARKAEADAAVAEVQEKFAAAGVEMPASVKQAMGLAFSGAEMRTVQGAAVAIIAAAVLMV